MSAASSGRTPRSTYRLQVRAGLTLDGVVEGGWLDALARLGVSHLYLSPVLGAVPGSTHGYDVVDHEHVDAELGGDEAFERLARAARERGLGLVVDLVPNHMAADPSANARWWDVLRNGPSSRWAELFDIDWDVPEARLAGRLLLPVLGDHAGREIEAGRFGVTVREDGEPVLTHPAVDVPLELGSLAPVLGAVPALADLAGPAVELGPFATAEPGERALRTATEERLRTELHARLRDPDARRAFIARMGELAADPARLDDLLESQPYRLARWRAGLEDLGYRRFFDVTTLVALRTDRREVFDLTHAAVRRWVEADLIDGVRIDHVDGLADPATYLGWLRELVGDRWIVVEKILETGEPLPAWPVDGTTGYEVAELVDRIDLADAGRAHLERLAEDAGAETDVEDVERRAMVEVLDELLSADLNRLVDLGVHLCERRRRLRDTTRRELREILVAVLGRFARYRTYVAAGQPAGDDDRRFLDEVFERVVEEVPHLDRDVVDFVHRLLAGDETGGAAEIEFATRFQQLSGPTRAKGCEDTAWYRLVALLARCEVGADPDLWGASLEDLHAAMAVRQATWPAAMTSLTTHDSKRSADVRAGIEVLSQWSTELVDVVESWWEDHGRGHAPELDVYAVQTLLGCPGIVDDSDRLRTHLTKAMREAKTHTSWLDPDEAVEHAVFDRVRLMAMDGPMTSRLARLRAEIERPVRTAILAHTLLGLTLPGVPDIYQGSETWHFRLVDPDNRERVDPASLVAALEDVESTGVGADDLLAKLAVVRAALRLRSERAADLGPAGDYRPLWAVGPRSDHAVAFARGDGVVTVVPRLVRRLADGWAGTAIALPDGTWRDAFGGATWSGQVPLDDLLGEWPVALLERVG